jgi:hypothetical protein
MWVIRWSVGRRLSARRGTPRPRLRSRRRRSGRGKGGAHVR